MKVITRAAIGVTGIAFAISGIAMPIAQAAVTAPARAARQQVAVAPARPAWVATILIRCGGRPTVEPSTFVLSCADANSLLIGLHWRSWRTHAAFGHGIQSINTCRPNCAAGHFRHHQVLVVLWGIKRLHDHDWYFTHLTLIYTQKHPPAHTPRTVTIMLTRRGPA